MLKAHDFRVTLVPLFQNESSSKTFQMKTSFGLQRQNIVWFLVYFVAVISFWVTWSVAKSGT